MSHALLPLKDLAKAKTRLSGVLRPSERRALALAMVEDVLSVLSAHPGITGITLLSDDPVAHLLAHSYQAHWLPESELRGNGLNAAVTGAVARLQASGQSELLVLHGDLPTLGAADISLVLRRQRKIAGLLIGTDLAESGTNLLAFGRAQAPRFSFGPGSCRAHREWAQGAGVPVAVVRQPGIAFDVDEVADLVRLLRPGGPPAGERTTALLRGWPMPRIEATLASLKAAGDESDKSRAEQ